MKKKKNKKTSPMVWENHHKRTVKQVIAEIFKYEETRKTNKRSILIALNLIIYSYGLNYVSLKYIC